MPAITVRNKRRRLINLIKEWEANGKEYTIKELAEKAKCSYNTASKYYEKVVAGEV